jgi:serine/threonine protein phosphatase PrpC
MDSLRGSKRVSVEAIKRALEGAGTSIEKGYTTASICSVSRKGDIALASVGDSPVYGIDKEGGISIELPLDRAVKEGDSSLKYFHYRNMLRSALGPGREKAVAHLRKGRIASGEGVLMASDGLSDNLFVEIEEGFVSDASGSRDLRSLIGEERSASAILSILEETIDERRKAGRMESGSSLMIPKEDDLAIIVFRFK